MTKDIFAICADLEALRTQVKSQLGVASCDRGDLWLPVVLTARGPLYAEAIAATANGKYHQPVHLADATKQPLYRLAYRLLQSLQASPAVYLLQFALTELPDASNVILFDRLIPFPDQPASASVGVQEPDLFACHLMCIHQEPIYDLVIKNSK